MKEKILSIIIMTLVLLVIGVTSVNAASISATTGNSNVKVGDTITVKVDFSDSKGVQFLLNYNSSIVQYVTDSTGGSGTTGSAVRIATASFNDSPVPSITVTFRAIAEGSTSFSISNPVLKDMSGTHITDGVSLSGTSATVKNPAPPPPPQEPDPTTPGGNTDPTTPGGNTTPTTPGGNTTPTTPGGNTTPTTPGGNTTPTTPGGNTNTAPEPENPTFKNDNSKVYATNNVNVRSSCLINSSVNNILGMLKKGDEITRTGVSNTWDRITYNGKTAYVRHGYLDTKKPDETDDDDNNTPVDENVIDNNVVNEPTEENNTITENNSVVGVTENTNTNTAEGDKYKNRKYIAIAISVGAIVVVGIIMFIIYKKVNNEDEEEEENANSKNAKNVSNKTAVRSTVARNSGTRNGTSKNNTTKTTNGKK